MEKKVLTQVSPVVLPWRVKILYAAGSFSKALLAVAMAAFMLYFYTDVCGMILPGRRPLSCSQSFGLSSSTP